MLVLSANWVLRVGDSAGLVERQAMASAFAAMPAKVLWRLSPSEVPDKTSLAELGIGNNTKVLLIPVPIERRQDMMSDSVALKLGAIKPMSAYPGRP